MPTQLAFEFAAACALSAPIRAAATAVAANVYFNRLIASPLGPRAVISDRGLPYSI
jgi:hypothetical protein